MVDNVKYMCVCKIEDVSRHQNLFCPIPWSVYVYTYLHVHLNILSIFGLEAYRTNKLC